MKRLMILEATEKFANSKGFDPVSRNGKARVAQPKRSSIHRRKLQRFPQNHPENLSTPTCDISMASAQTSPDPQELWKLYHRRADTHTENALVEQYVPLVRAVVGRLAMTLPDHVDSDDLHSAGLIGLLQALRNYDPSSGTSFEGYARRRIRGAMLDELRRMDWVPRTVHEKARRIQRLMSEQEQRLGRTPTEPEMARAMKISVAEYSELLDEVRPAAFLCLDAAPSADSDDHGSLYEVVPNNDDGPAEETSQRELKQVILERLKELPDMQRKVLALYYGEDLHLREIAEAFDLTESRICQIHSQAILSIRAYLQRFENGLVNRARSPQQP
jgi:RNA polymerase sigma factor FliA